MAIMFDRRLVEYFDWGLLALTLMLASIGLVILYSAETAGIESPQKILFYKQIVWYSIGLTVMVVCFLFDYKMLDRWAHVVYLLNVCLLIGVLYFGKSAGGSRRWLDLGPISIQPSELCKIAVIIVLARYYSKLVKTDGFTLRELVAPFVFTMIPFLLIVRQPDLGTAMVLFLIAASIALFVKIERRSLLSLIFASVGIMSSGWFFLRDYQKQRILTFLNPDRDPLGSGYHIIQSKIAIGSGQIFGKGFLKGTQNVLSFLPEQHTDFIFSVLAEEWGFAGSILVISLFLVLIVWGLNIAHECRDPFGIILAFGATAMIFWQVIINIGMVMGLMPVVGVPLPFISYGGSSIITIMICVGLLMNVSMRRFLIE